MNPKWKNITIVKFVIVHKNKDTHIKNIDSQNGKKCPIELSYKNTKENDYSNNI